MQAICKQTYTNIEFIICDDCSTDQTFQKAKELQRLDNRILLLRNDTNLGLGKTLNRCLKAATGAFVARMDADDDCVPERIQLQVEYLKNHPEFEIVSSAMSFFDEDGEWGRNQVVENPSLEQVVTDSPICHAPVMMWKRCLDSVGGYSEKTSTIRVEDVDLWIRLYEYGYRYHNLNKPLYKMRNDRNAFRRRKFIYRVNSTKVRIKACYRLGLGARCWAMSFIPMIIGLIPSSIRRAYRKSINQKNQI